MILMSFTTSDHTIKTIDIITDGDLDFRDDRILLVGLDAFAVIPVLADVDVDGLVLLNLFLLVFLRMILR